MNKEYIKAKERLISLNYNLTTNLDDYISFDYISENIFPYTCIDKKTYEPAGDVFSHEVFSFDSNKLTFDQLTAFVYAINENIRSINDDGNSIEPSVVHCYYRFLINHGTFSQQNYDLFFTEAKEFISEKHLETHNPDYETFSITRRLFINCKELAMLSLKYNIKNNPDVCECLLCLKKYSLFVDGYGEEEIYTLLSDISHDFMCDIDLIFSERCFCEFSLNIKKAVEDCNYQTAGILFGINEGNKFYALEHIELGDENTLSLLNNESFIYDEGYIRHRIDLIQSLYDGVMMEVVGVYVTRMYDFDDPGQTDIAFYSEVMIDRDLKIIDQILKDYPIYSNLSKPFYIKGVVIADRDSDYIEKCLFNLADVNDKISFSKKDIGYSVSKDLPAHMKRLRSYFGYYQN